MSAATTVTVAADSSSDVAVRWTAAAGSPTPDGYFVIRTNGTTSVAACASSPTALLSTTSCVDRAVADGNYSYTVTAVHRSWTAISAPSSVIAVATATHLSFTVDPSTTAAGALITPAVTVTLLSAAGKTVTTAGVPVTVAVGRGSPAGALTGTLTAATNSAGTATFTGLSIDTAGAGFRLTATGSALASATSAPFTVTPPPLMGPRLGSTASYSILGTAATNTGVTTISGDLGSSPAATNPGFPAGTVQGETHAGDASAAAAAADLAAAYADAAGRTATSEFAGDLAGVTFTPGIHHTAAAMALSAGTTLTLDGQGDPNAVFIIQVDAALNTAANSTIRLINGAVASNVYWQANGAVGTGADSFFSGTILAAGAITIGARAQLIGRALSQGAVTLASNAIRFTLNPPID